MNGVLLGSKDHQFQDKVVDKALTKPKVQSYKSKNTKFTGSQSSALKEWQNIQLANQYRIYLKPQYYSLRSRRSPLFRFFQIPSRL